ncbi:MAG: hypothetical protein IPN32_26560 [Deltaproteobacteria bacterium]|nr:hypothetical protein [Deltaproteobacteria bacterium]
MLEPVASVQAPCPATVVCSFSDVDGDGKADLVRRDPSGTFADPGTIAVAYGNGWG